MSPVARIGGFVLALAVVFAAAIGVGRIVGPRTEPAAPAAHAMDEDGTGQAPATPEAKQEVGGLGMAEGDYRLELASTDLPVGVPATLGFRIVDGRGIPVSAFTEVHEEPMHVFVVRRDLSNYQHVHATMAGDGTWTVPITIAEPGSYRVIADFQPAMAAEGVTLGADLSAAGLYQPHPLPPSSATATVDGYTVTLNGALIPGHPTALKFTVRQNGVGVTDLQPYLGAFGHLVVLRAGDLAHLHVHPNPSAPGPDITFAVETPSAATYRLFLEFQHAGAVHRAEFTAAAAGALPYPSTSDSATTGAPVPTESAEHGHGGGN
jgi:hypothetical protein